MSLFNELKRRNVFRVGIAYIIAAWLLLQVADVVLNNIEAPGWVFQAIMLVLGLGFPIAVIFAWAFEVTPEGIKKEKEVDRSQSIVDHTGRKLDRVIIAVLVLALGYFTLDKFVLDPRADAELVADAGQAEQEQPAAEVEDRKSIAVLPFASRSDQASDEYFTEGIHDDLLTHLAKIGSMKVISRTSVMRYKGTEKSIPEIAEELGVATILEGGIQRSGSQVRINVQLIDAKTDEHLWAEIFDRQLTAENLFAIQSEIATKIANALEATLSPEEQTRLADVPTTNMAAYNAYLRGRQLQTRRTSTDLEQALAEYTRATELDPQYALAWVGIAECSALLSNYGTLSYPESIKQQEIATKKALEINDELGEAHASLGNVYSYREQESLAEAAFLRAIELNPNYASAYHWYAGLLSTMSDRLDESIEMMEKAAELDPMSSIIQSGLASLQAQVGRYKQAERQYLRGIELAPDFAVNYASLAGLYSRSLGRFADGLKLIRIARQKDPGNISYLFFEAILNINVGNYDAVESLQQLMQDMDAQSWTIGASDMNKNISQGNYAGAIEAGHWVLNIMANQPFVLEFVGLVYILDGDFKHARELITQAYPGWDHPDQWPELIRLDDSGSCTVAWLFTKTGDKKMAADLMQETIAYHVSLERLIEHADLRAPFACWLAQGEFGKALDILETQVEHGHIADWWVNFKYPWWDEVRAESRFQAAMQSIEDKVAEQRLLIEEMNLETDA